MKKRIITILIILAIFIGSGVLMFADWGDEDKFVRSYKEFEVDYYRCGKSNNHYECSIQLLDAGKWHGGLKVYIHFDLNGKVTSYSAGEEYISNPKNEDYEVKGGNYYLRFRDKNYATIKIDIEID